MNTAALTDLNERGVTFYAFPRPRVKRVGEFEAARNGRRRFNQRPSPSSPLIG